jgi:transcriptional regulator with XRE-family HTH domain
MSARPGSASYARRLGARIRAVRMAAELTQERLAWECDLDKGYLSQVESGKRQPSLTVLAAIAQRLELTVADLVGFDLTHPRLELLDAARLGDVARVAAALRALALGIPPTSGILRTTA